MRKPLNLSEIWCTGAIKIGIRWGIHFSHTQIKYHLKTICFIIKNQLRLIIRVLFDGQKLWLHWLTPHMKNYLYRITISTIPHMPYFTQTINEVFPRTEKGNRTTSLFVSKTALLSIQTFAVLDKFYIVTNK